jgi:hypothetical protein
MSAKNLNFPLFSMKFVPALEQEKLRLRFLIHEKKENIFHFPAHPP